jgi:acyl-CoA thioester hydrolase
MEYLKKYVVEKDYVDENGCMHSIYYPYYMELCRRDYLKDILGFDFAEEAVRDIYMKISQYSIKSFGMLKASDNFVVTCAVFIGSTENGNFNFKQSVIKDGRIISLGIFSLNCVMDSNRDIYGNDA